MQIATLISGGVDSSVAVHLLCEQGYKPDLFYIKIGVEEENGLSCTAEEDLEMATFIARRYGLHLEVVDLHRQYWENVVTYAIDRLKRGLTPNPDVMCNKLIKFGCFEKEVGYSYDKTATGHYANVREIDGVTWMTTAKDPVKDQTDFLAQIDYLQLSKLMFPLGGLMKQEVRELATSAKLPSAQRKDSQGICFLGRINYNQFIQRFLGNKVGNIIELETGKQIGTHQGYWYHTIGQRKGLGLSQGPWFVVDKDIEENIIYVSHADNAKEQHGKSFVMQDFHFISKNPWDTVPTPIPITFKIRHAPEFIEGLLYKEGSTYMVESAEELQGIAPGQYGVIYDKNRDICIGSGEIRI